MRRIALVLPFVLIAGCDLGGTFNIAAGVGGSCANDTNCRPGLACRDSVCEPNGATAEGSACLLSDECATGLYCSLELKCAPAGEGEAGDLCSSPGDCARGFFCRLDGLQGTCEETGSKDIGGECLDHEECLGGLICLKGECQPPARVLESAEEETCRAAETGALRALFEVPRGGERPNDFYALPFPNDIRTKDGHPVIADHPTPGAGVVGADVVKRYLEHAEAKLDGFSTNPTVFFRFNKGIEFSTVTGGGDAASLRFVDLDTGADLGMSWSYSSSRNRFICGHYLAVRPQRGRPLAGGHTFAVVLTSGVKDTAGVAAQADADFTAMLAANAPADPDLAAAWTRYAKLREWMTDKAIDPSRLVNAAVFTTGRPMEPMRRLYDAAAALAVAPLTDVTVCEAGTVSPCAAGDEARACGVHDDFTEIHAKLALPIFQAGTAPYTSEGGAISVDASGKPKVVRTESVCLAITVPKNGAAPAGGWPAVVYMHGTGGSFRSHVLDGTAASLSQDAPGGNVARFVTVGFDAVVHGPRKNGSDRSSDELMFNYLNPDAAIGNWLQGSADAWTVLRAVRGLSLPAGSVDGTKVYFLGHSQGGTHGALMLPFEKSTRVAMLSGAGGLLIDSLLGKRSPVDIAGAVQVALLERQLGGYHPALALLQGAFDAVDPINFGAAITTSPLEGSPAKSVFMSYGVGDTYTPVATMQNLALSMSLDLANVPPLEPYGAQSTPMPVRGNQRGGQTTAVVQQFAKPAEADSHFVIFRDPDAKRRVAAWFATAAKDLEGIPSLVE